MTDTITRETPDRIERLYQNAYISKEQRDKCVAIREMFHAALTRTPEYVRWSRQQDTQIIDLGSRPNRLQLVIDLVIQDHSISQIENSLRMEPGTVLQHFKAAINEFEL